MEVQDVTVGMYASYKDSNGHDQTGRVVKVMDYGVCLKVNGKRVYMQAAALERADAPAEATEQQPESTPAAPDASHAAEEQADTVDQGAEAATQEAEENVEDDDEGEEAAVPGSGCDVTHLRWFARYRPEPGGFAVPVQVLEVLDGHRVRVEIVDMAVHVIQPSVVDLQDLQ